MHHDMSILFAIFLVSFEMRRMRPCLLEIKLFLEHTEHIVQSISCKVSINIQSQIAVSYTHLTLPTNREV